MSSYFKLISRAVLAGLFVLSVQVGASAAEKLSDKMETNIKNLIVKAIIAGDATVLEDGLFDLVENNTGLAVAVAGYASSQLPATLPAGLPADFMLTLVVATAAGPTLADPSKTGDITEVVETNQPKHAAAMITALQTLLADLEGLAGIETAAGGGPPSTPPGPPTITPPNFTNPTAISATAENPSVVSASPGG